jgi:predicted RNase H-like nuclease
MMPKIYGLDGCKDGWIGIAEDLESGLLSWDVYDELADLLKIDPHPGVIAIDIPIGLPEKGARSCDREARRLLGRPRGSSVFPANRSAPRCYHGVMLLCARQRSTNAV